MKKGLKYAIAIVALIVVAYNSIYFRKLDEVKASASKDFDAKSYSRKYYDNKLLPAQNNAIEINQLLTLVQREKDKTFDQYSHALGIGNIRFFLIKGQGQITSIDENDVSILVKTDTSQRTLQIATEFVFGNAIRDALGIIDINEFKNTMDFNNVSAELNMIIRNEVLPSFKKDARKGDIVRFSGAIELNREHLNTEKIEIVPVSLKIVGR